MKMINACDYTVDAVGSAYGLANIQTILGIIVLVLTIFNILFKMCIAIYNKVKKREYEAITKVVDEAIEQLEEVGSNAKSE